MGLRPGTVSHVLGGDEKPYSPGSLICFWGDSIHLGADPLGDRGKAAQRVGLEAGKAFRGSTVTVDLLFSWPEDKKNIPQLYLEFKRSARAQINTARLARPNQ